MKKFSTLSLIIAVILLCGAVVSATYVYQVKLQGNLTVGENPQAGTSFQVGAYSDPGCTNPITHVDFPDIVAGSDAATTIYLKNNGTGTITGFSTIINLYNEQGQDAGSSTENTNSSLAPGQSMAFPLFIKLSISPTFPPGDYDLSINIECYG